MWNLKSDTQLTWVKKRRHKERKWNNLSYQTMRLFCFHMKQNSYRNLQSRIHTRIYIHTHILMHFVQQLNWLTIQFWLPIIIRPWENYYNLLIRHLIVYNSYDFFCTYCFFVAQVRGNHDYIKYMQIKGDIIAKTLSLGINVLAFFVSTVILVNVHSSWCGLLFCDHLSPLLSPH